jgi:hypothetical protein
MTEVRGEPRWPMSLTVVVVIVLLLLLPERMSSLPRWALPGVLTILLIALVATDPGAITKTGRELRWLSIALVVMLAAAALNATTLLIRDLIEGSPTTQNPTTLLATGGAVWVITIAAFALLYWEFDGGGPAARAHGMPRSPDIAFPQQLTRRSRRPTGGRDSSTTCIWASPTRWPSAPPTRCRSFHGRSSRWRSKP